MDRDTRWWRIWSAARARIADLGLPFYLWPELAHGRIESAVTDRAGVHPRLTQRTVLVPHLTIHGGKIGYGIAETTSTEPVA